MLRTAAVAAALAAAGPLAAQPPAPASPPAGAPTRAHLLKTLVPPPTTPGLPPDVDVAFADTHVQIALSDPAPENKAAILDAARARYQRVLRQDPAHKGALIGLARMAVGLDDRDRAAAAFDRYLTAHPTDAAARHEAGLACARFRDWAGAVEHCAAAVRLDPDSRTYGTHLGFCLARAGRWEEAHRALARVMPEAQARANLELARAHAARLAADVPTTVVPDVVVTGATGPLPAAVAPVAPAPRELPTLTAAYRLRNVAATDTASAVVEHLGGGGREVTITPVGPTNELVVHGSAATHARVAALVAELDRTPTQIVIPTTMVQVPAGFLRECGLARPGAADAVWTLTEREAALFAVALRHHPKVTVLSRPQVQVNDGQTGYVQVGQDVWVGLAEPTPTGPGRRVERAEFVPSGVSTRLTPRLSPSGKAMLLRVEAEVSAPAPRPEIGRGAAFPFNVQTVQTTVTVPTGQTVVLSVSTTGADGKPAAVLYVMTPTVVRQQ